MQFPEKFKEFQRMSARGGCHGRGLELPVPPEPEAGLSFLGRVRWHLREYLRPKSKEERLFIKLAKKRWD